MFDQFSYLYVEDDPLSQEVMQMLMENAMGVTELHIFHDSANFMERLLALKPQPHLFLLDIHIQPYSGLDLLKMLRAHPDYAQSKVIALTASVMHEEIKLLRSAGFDGAISKPLSMSTFPSLIERILQGEIVWHIS